MESEIIIEPTLWICYNEQACTCATPDFPVLVFRHAEELVGSICRTVLVGYGTAQHMVVIIHNVQGPSGIKAKEAYRSAVSRNCKVYTA